MLPSAGPPRRVRPYPSQRQYQSNQVTGREIKIPIMREQQLWRCTHPTAEIYLVVQTVSGLDGQPPYCNVGKRM